MTCTISPDKRRYRDHLAAKLALAHIQTNDARRPKAPVRAYACPGCAGWHLTSWPTGNQPDQEHTHD